MKRLSLWPRCKKTGGCTAAHGGMPTDGVHAAFVRVRGLLFDLGLSPHRDEAASIKLEVNTRPPEGATLATTIVRRHDADTVGRLLRS